MRTTMDILRRAKQLSLEGTLSRELKIRALEAMADHLIQNSNRILSANREDICAASGRISDVMIDRLMLNESRISAMADGLRAVAALPDPVGRILDEKTRNDGLVIQKVSVPFGVVAIIYESRPNVTSDAAALSFKSGNVCVLRSGRDAFQSAKAIVDALKAGLKGCGLSEDYINLIEDTDRRSANELMTAVGLVDLLIPRGGKGLIQACTQHAKVPCVETGTGICHIYVDQSADIDMALRIIDNAKTSRPSVCNAAEVCLVHREAAGELLPKLAKRLQNPERAQRVELRGDESVCRIIDAVPATEADFDTEFLDYILAIKVVDSIQEATAHIAAHSTHHSDCIITEDTQAADFFVSHVDSAAVYVNASTRFTDGGEFGLGCEMGISTQKLHARGPMGISELTTYRYIVRGNGQIR